jgi:S1-C subfamily serine protease
MVSKPTDDARREVLRQVAATGLCLACSPRTRAEPLPDLIDRIRPGIVGIGTFEATRRPPNVLLGTGFAIGDGTRIATNAHVLPVKLNEDRRERVVAYVGRGERPSMRAATVLRTEPRYDLAILRIDGPPLPALELGSSDAVREGQEIAFTGFPIGAVLGLYPVTHRGIVSAITPIAVPQPSVAGLDPRQLAALRNPYPVFQLDATAYPGNSGSPVFELTHGEVIGIINQVFVKETKENVLKDPSAISYAVPIAHLTALLRSLD